MAHSESVILDVTDFDAWPKHVVGYPEHETGGVIVPPDKRSTIIQQDRDAAEREAVRLAQAHPGHRFAVFTLVGIVETKEVPTHITLGGSVISTTKKPIWHERDL